MNWVSGQIDRLHIRQAAKIEAQRNSLQETLSNVKKDKHTMDQLSRMSNANRKRLRNRYTTSK